MGKWRETYNANQGSCIDVDGTLYSSNHNLAALRLIGVHNADIDALQAEIDNAIKIGKLILNHLPKAKRLFPDRAESDSLDLIMTKLMMVVVEPNEEEE